MNNLCFGLTYVGNIIMHRLYEITVKVANSLPLLEQLLLCLLGLLLFFVYATWFVFIDFNCSKL